MTEQSRYKEELQDRIVVSDLTQEDVRGFSDFVVGIVTALPYYSKDEKLRFCSGSTPERFAQRLEEEDSVLVVAKDGEKIVGFGVGQAQRIAGAGDEPVGYISWIGVDPALGRQGVASAVTSRMEERFLDKGVTKLVAFIKDDNVPSRNRALHKRGYTEDPKIAPALSANSGGRFYSRPLTR